MIELGLQNSRMKDFFDLWILPREFAFDGTSLTAAIAATFRRRKTGIPSGVPDPLTAAFGADRAKRTQWQAFLLRARVKHEPPPFEQVLDTIARFVLPPAHAAYREDAFDRSWPPDGPWK
jgi:hypothetical protein